MLGVLRLGEAHLQLISSHGQQFLKPRRHVSKILRRWHPDLQSDSEVEELEELEELEERREPGGYPTVTNRNGEGSSCL